MRVKWMVKLPLSWRIRRIAAWLFTAMVGEGGGMKVERCWVESVDKRDTARLAERSAQGYLSRMGTDVYWSAGERVAAARDGAAQRWAERNRTEHASVVFRWNEGRVSNANAVVRQHWMVAAEQH